MTINRNLSILAGGVSSAGVLGVPNGGSGAITLTGYLIGNGTGAFTASATIPTSALSGTVSLTTQVSGILPIANGGTAQSSFTAGYVHFGSFSTDSNLFWDNTNKRLGVGTSSPSVALDVSTTENSASGQLRIASSGSNGTRLGIISTSTNGKTYQIGSNFILGVGEFGIYDATSAATRLLIYSTGGVSIGNTTDPGATNLSVNGNLYVGSTSNIVNSRFVTKFDQTGNSGLGIQNTSATATGYMVAFYNSSATLQGSINQVSSTITAYSTTSDYRLKNNVMPIDNALDTIKALKPISFTWDDGRKDDGFLAHELQTVIPNCVIGEKDAVNENGTPKYQQMDNSGVIPFLVKAIQEQQLIIEQLKAKVGI
jgi:hypothetical protein